MAATPTNDIKKRFFITPPRGQSSGQFQICQARCNLQQQDGGLLRVFGPPQLTGHRQRPATRDEG